MSCFANSLGEDEMTEKELELENKTQRGVKVSGGGLKKEVPLEMPHAIAI